MEAGVLSVSREVEGLPSRRAEKVPRVVVGVVAACSMLGLLAWSCSGSASEGALLPTPTVAYVPAGMVPFRQPLPAMQRPAVPVMQVGTPTAPGAYPAGVAPIGTAPGAAVAGPPLRIPQDSTILVQGGS